MLSLQDYDKLLHEFTVNHADTHTVIQSTDSTKMGWYGQQQKQNEFKSNCVGNCDYLVDWLP